jgi:hypothetical protein
VLGKLFVSCESTPPYRSLGKAAILAISAICCDFRFQSQALYTTPPTARLLDFSLKISQVCFQKLNLFLSKIKIVRRDRREVKFENLLRDAKAKKVRSKSEASIT